jgi:hypothetical protein
MSESAQGPDWWRASDGMWYPPESHPDYVARRVLGPAGESLRGPGVQTTRAPTQMGAPVLTEARPSGGAPSGPSSSHGPFTPLRVVSLAALVVSLVGVNLPWATAALAVSGLHLRASVAGIGVGSGQLLCAVLVVVLLLSWWHLAATSRRTAVALFGSWVGALALSVYELFDIIAVPTRGVVAIDVGVGLYLCTLAALVGSVCSLTDAAQLWSVSGPAHAVAPGAMWVGALVALGVVAAMSFVGYGAGDSPVGPIPVLSPDQPVDNGAGGPGPTGGGSTGGTGSTGATGSTGNTGNSGNFGPSGTTGSSGNSGPGGDLGNSGSGNSGLGNSGPGLFGNSGPGEVGVNPPGSSGAGTSAPAGPGSPGPAGTGGTGGPGAPNPTRGPGGP